MQQEKAPSRGIVFEKVDGELAPPGAGEEEKKEGPPEKPSELKAVQAMPLHPAMIRLPLRAEGAILTAVTGFPGWEYAEQDLNDLAELARQVDIRLNPTWQLVMALLALHAVHAIGFVAWLKAGKPAIEKIEKEGVGGGQTAPTQQPSP